ncbi:hypothetical protein DIPPA_14313 [Diplonema papillatum]|nr:hypothetical protein DIPPA_14313 [Diplonema papillatum]
MSTLAGLAETYEAMLRETDAGAGDREVLATVMRLHERTLALSEKTARVQEQLVPREEWLSLRAGYAELQAAAEALEARTASAEHTVQRLEGRNQALEADNANLRTQLEHLQRASGARVVPMKVDLSFGRLLSARVSELHADGLVLATRAANLVESLEASAP